MKLQKNLAAKLGAIVASLLALAGTLVLVHRNPPADAQTASQSAAAAATPAVRTRRSITGQGTNQSQRAPSTHTRTHVS